MFRSGLIWGDTCPLRDEHDENNNGGGDIANHDGAHSDGADGDKGDDGKKEAAGSDDEKPITKKDLLELLGGFKNDVAKQVNALDKKLKEATKAPPPPAPKKETPKFEDPEKEELRTRLEQAESERKAEREKSMIRERNASVSTALSEFPWKDKDDRAVAQDYYTGKATQGDDGEWEIQGMPIEEFIKKHAPARFRGMWTPRDLGGSGNSGSKRTGSSGTFDLNDITPDLIKDPVKDAAFRKTVAGLLAQAQQG